MILKTDKQKADIFLVFVPHRDVRKELENCGNALLPWVAPLALLNRPFSTDELKYCAFSLRNTMKEQKFCAKEESASLFTPPSKNVCLYGLRMNMEITPEILYAQTEASNNKIISVFSAPVIGAYLKPVDLEPTEKAISFHAGAIANMYLKPLQIGYEWEIEKLVWLPKPRIPKN